MTKKGSDQTSLDTRIQALERELASLKAQARARLNPPAPPPLELSTDANWLIDTLRYLVTEHDETGTDYALAQLGEFLELMGSSLWRLDERHRQAQKFAHWQDPELPSSLPESWVEQILADKGGHLAMLQSGHPLVIRQEGATAALATLLATDGIGSSALVPLQRNHSTVGLMSLHRRQAAEWQPRELELAGMLGDMLMAVDERRQLLRKLAARDTRFQYAMEASRDGLWDWDVATDNVYFSHSYLRMLGYQDQQVPHTAKTFRDLFLLPEDAEEVMDQFRLALETGREHFNLEFRLRHKTGRIVWVYCRAKFFEPDAQGRPTRCVGINADVTDFISTQEELLAAKTQADLANRVKDEFLARMSHEIRTPMNAIIGLGHLLRDSELDERQKGYLESMNAASDSLLHIINQLLDFSRIESGKIVLENAHFDLELVLERLSRLFEVSTFHRELEIIYDIHKDVPRFLRGDAARLSQVLSNLVGNALEHASGNRVLVKVVPEHSDQKSVLLNFSITDFGAGMSREEIERMSSMLGQHPESSLISDSGFGLSICQHLISLMQGHISIDNAPGQGCRISFTAAFEHSHIGAKTLLEQPHQFENLRALIVDDSSLARDIIAGTLRSMRLAADCVQSAEEALAHIRNADSKGRPYQLVLMDYKMPKCNGLEAATMIKEDRSLTTSPKVFLVSSHRRDEISSNDASSALVDAFLTKPLSESRLFDAMVQVFNGGTDREEPSGEQLLAVLTGVKVLLVEDNQVNQMVAAGMLRKGGMEVTTAQNGREAVERLHSDPYYFDVILMDLEMPERDGYQATRDIRSGSAGEGIPIIALTAQALRGDRERCLDAGMNGYLSKPISPNLLYRTIAQNLDPSIVGSDQ